MVSPVKLAHVALKTNNLPQARAWYLTVLDAKVVFENDALCFTTYDDEHHRLVLAKVDGFEQDATSAGLHHMSFTYADLDQLFDTYERLQGEGIAPVWCINHGPTLSMYYLDPMANHVELQIDTMSMAAANEFIHSDVFEKNPIGIEFDPDVLNDKRKTGASFEDLVAYGD